MVSRLLSALICISAVLITMPLFAAPKKTVQSKPVLAATPQEEVLWDWWFVYAGGQSPSREVIYIDALSVEKVVDHAAIMNADLNVKLKKFPIDYIQADGISITENPEKPAKTSGAVRVKCDARQMMFDQSYLQYWDADRFVTVPATGWFDIGNDLRFTQIALFLCEPKKRNRENMMMRAAQTSDPLDVTWDAIWNDVKKPKFTTKKTREQIDAEYNAVRAKTVEQLGEAQAAAETRIADIKNEDAFLAWIRKNFKSKNKKFRELFQTMLAWDEAQIISALGAPIRTYMDRSMTVLVFPYQDTVTTYVQVPVDVMKCGAGACGKVGETTQPQAVSRTVNCERSLYLGVGGSKPKPRLVDYAYQCF
jgi:hypothetical protein